MSYCYSLFSHLCASGLIASTLSSHLKCLSWKALDLRSSCNGDTRNVLAGYYGPAVSPLLETQSNSSAADGLLLCK